MKVLIVTSEFPPEPQTQSRMVLDLTTALAWSGHHVQVVCPHPSRPAGASYDSEELGILEASLADQGVKLTRVHSFITTESRLWPRICESWSFGRSAAAAILKNGDADILYDAVWPMLAQAWVGSAARRRGIPEVSHIMDIYPESAYPKVPRWVRLGARKPLLALDRANALRARKLVVISESMRKIYEETRGIPPGHMEVIHTWQDDSLFDELPERQSATRRYHLPADCFRFLYLGNIGVVAGVDHLIRSFARAGLHGAQLVIVGEGTQKRACEQLASQARVDIRFISDPKAAHVPLLQSLADVCLLPVKRGAAFSSFPSKLCGYMLSAKPVLASVDEQSESARLIRQAECGWVVHAEDIDALARRMRQLQALRGAELAAAGSRGRGFALEHLSKKQGVEKLLGVVLGSARDYHTVTQIKSERATAGPAEGINTPASI